MSIQSLTFCWHLLIGSKLNQASSHEPPRFSPFESQNPYLSSASPSHPKSMLKPINDCKTQYTKAYFLMTALPQVDDVWDVCTLSWNKRIHGLYYPPLIQLHWSIMFHQPPTKKLKSNKSLPHMAFFLPFLGSSWVFTPFNVESFNLPSWTKSNLPETKEFQRFRIRFVKNNRA